MVIQKYSHYILSPAVTYPYTLSIADSLDESRGFVVESPDPGKMAYYTGFAQILLSGLLVWVIFFWLFFRSVVKRLRILKIIGLSFLTYLLYALVSLVFSFMLGFGFLLGLILMISIVKFYTGETSTIRLFAFSFMTSLLTAITMFLLGSFVF